jgi:poly(3-hydroxybutyrate) depolymerase
VTIRKAVRLPLLAGLLVGFVAGLARAQDPPKPPPQVAWSQIQKKTYEFKSGDTAVAMEYALFVPSTYDKAKKTPLVVALHGLYSNPQQIMRYPGLIEQAEKYGYLVVAPMGFNNHGWYGAKMLVKGTDADPKNLPELSEQDVMNVLDLTRKAYNVDPERIYLCGHSMGGGGTWYLAVKYPNLWAALAPIAPAPVVLPAEAEKIKHLPVILVQGDADVLVKVQWVRPWADEMKKLGMTYEYIEVPGGDHITVAFKNLPKIFEFFEKHKRGEGKGSGGDKATN